ncbi:uncharacterized protein [Oryza sativa Japonica Group]|uniref:uncharacterized protein n=1 Tax=Oryza sativa subsp. japonica TaxID=39947 RepID=UPI00339C012D
MAFKEIKVMALKECRVSTLKEFKVMVFREFKVEALIKMTMRHTHHLSPPSSSLSRAAGRLQPPLSPCLCVGWSRHHLSRPRSRLLSHGLPSVLRGDRRRRVPAVALLFPPRRPPPAASPSSPERRPAVPSPSPASQPPPLRRRCLRFVGKSPETCPAGVQWRRHHYTVSGRLLFVAGTPTDVAVSSVDVAASSSPPAAPRFRRNAVARATSPSVPPAPSPAAPSAVPVCRPTSPSPPPALQRQGRPRPRLPFVQTPPRSIVVVSVRSRRRRPVDRPARRLAALPPSWASLRRVPRRPHLRAAAAGCPHRLPVGRRLPPSSSLWRSSLRQADRVRRPRFVKCAAAPSSSSSSAPRRQALCQPRLAFVQGSPLKSSPRRSSPSFPAASAAPVRRCRSHASSRGGL